MSDAIDQSLSTVHALIEAEKLSEARIVLEPLLETNKDNIDVWWLYAHAVQDSASARTALENVFRLDPKYPGASELMRALEQQESGQDSKPDGVSDEDLDFDDFDEDFEDEIQKPAGRRKLVIWFSGFIVVVAVIIVAALIITSLGEDNEDPSATPTPVAQVAVTNTPWPVASPESTEVLVETAPATETDVPATETDVPAQLSGFEIVVNALEGLELFQPTNELTETTLGATLLVSICTDNSESIRDTLNTAMTTMAGVHSDMDTNVEALGVRLMNCRTEAIINVIAVSRSDAEAFAEGTLTDAEFLSRWRPVG